MHNIKSKKKKRKVYAVIPLAFLAIVVILTFTVFIPNIKYNKAVALMNHEDYDSALELFNSLKGYKDSNDLSFTCSSNIKENKYNAAIELMNSDNYADAIVLFEEINGYKDADEKCYKCGYNLRLANLEDAAVGDIVKWGNYEQDNNDSNGKEEIEWLVLDVREKSILLLSKYALDNQPYNETHDPVVWNDCTLKEWLNDVFINEAFTPEEQLMILTATVTADENPEYSTNTGWTTQDKIFLLSAVEAEKYFNADLDRQCEPSYYAKMGGTNDFNSNCWWWLRTPGYDSLFAATVDGDGIIHYDGSPVSLIGDAVRPALWINLDM